MLEKIRWGVLGYAKIAHDSVLPALMRASNAELYAVASRDKSKLEECLSKFPFKKPYLSYDELLDDPDIDSVYIPLPNSMHKDWAIKAMRKKKHVLCEKPMALTLNDCEEMINESKINNVKLMEAFMYRYTLRTKKVLELLKSNIIGEVKYINSTYRFSLTNPNSIKLNPELGGGSLFDVGCYPINFIGMIINDYPESFSCEFHLQNNVDVIFTGILKYKSGIIGVVNCGFNAIKQVHSIIIGTKGEIVVPDTFLDFKGFIKVITENGIEEISIDQSDRYKWEIEDFSDSIINNRVPYFSLEETKRNIKLLEEFQKLIKKKIK